MDINKHNLNVKPFNNQSLEKAIDTILTFLNSNYIGAS